MTASAYPIGPRLFLTASCHACDIPTKHTLSLRLRPPLVNLLRSPSVNVVVAARDAALLSTTILILFYRNSNPPEWAYNTRFPNAIIHVDEGGRGTSLVSPLCVPRISFPFRFSLLLFRKITRNSTNVRLDERDVFRDVVIAPLPSSLPQVRRDCSTHHVAKLQKKASEKKGRKRVLDRPKVSSETKRGE